ncbi:MAG: tetratricopeptide repeat protein [Hyphomonadaceae bacterium]|nr:tetratricopeptide repeat protein [Hyphomonadaceae bacterium]
MQTSPRTTLFTSTAIKTMALAAGLTLLAGCETATNFDATTSKIVKTEKMVSTMVLPATTKNESAQAHYDAGWADYENARNVTAHKHFVAAAAADPSFTMADMMAAWTANSTKGFVTHTRRAAASKAGASQAEQHLVGMIESFLANDAEGATKHAKLATDLVPKSARAWDFLGATYANTNSTDKARAAYKMATKLDAAYVPGFLNLGNNYMTAEPKDFAKAEKYFRKAVALTPNEPNPHDLLGDVHRAQNNLKAAYKDYTKAAELAPELGSGLQQRGHVNSFMGNYAEARADYTRAAELEEARGSNAGPAFRVFGAYVHLHKGDHAAAIKELQEIADGLAGSTMEGASGQRVNALQNIALIATEIGKFDIAKQAIADAGETAMKQAEAVDSDDIKSAVKANQYYMKGLLAARMGDSEKAMAKAKAFKEQVASNTNPRKHERLYEIKGMTAYHQGDYAKAAEYLAKSNHVNNMHAKYYLARAHEKAGNTAGAAKLYDEMAVYNFNGPGYAMFRKDIVERAKG